MKERNALIDKLEEFINKYYRNLLIKGLLFFSASFTIFFIFFSFLEFLIRFESPFRSILFWLFIVINSIVFYKWIVIPLLGFYRIGKSLSHKEAARVIGLYFSDVQDKLLNILQLQEISQSQNELIEASIEQKSEELKSLRFSNAVDYKQNFKYIKYAAIPILIIASLLISGNKEVLVDSSERILSFNTEFVEEAPFQFDNGKSYFMSSKRKGSFDFELKNLQKSFNFRLKASTFYSDVFLLKVLPKPNIIEFVTLISPPKYINKEKEKFQNKGNLFIAEGSVVSWELKTKNTTKLSMCFQNDKPIDVKQINENTFSIKKKISDSQEYKIIANNPFANGDSLVYNINVVKDKFPNIQIEEYRDSANSNIRFISGQISDDYGLKKLYFNFRSFEQESQWDSRQLAIDYNLYSQMFSYLEMIYKCIGNPKLFP